MTSPQTAESPPSGSGLVVPITQAASAAGLIPAYLSDTYWWAYVHPRAVRIFERQWLVNLILWGQFRRLRDAALDALGTSLAGRTLQIACVYGDFSQRLIERITPDGRLDIIDVLPVQLANTRAKLAAGKNMSSGNLNAVHLGQHDSAALDFDDASFDRAILFFLLHEQPEAVRRRTLAEAWRVLKPGGKILVIDYHRPALLHPLRALMYMVLHTLEPFALDLWRQPLSTWLPAEIGPDQIFHQTYFGGLYQQLVISK